MLKRLVIIFAVLLVSYFVLYKIYIPRVSAFGCFDDCFSYAAGYFLNHNKILYSGIFYNHQMLPAYISSIIQATLNPINIFDLVLKHRQFVMLFGFIFNFVLVFRFGIPAFLFFLFFEFSKFYIFGDRFLGEAILVYPLVYLVFVIWRKLKKIKLDNFDYMFSAISLWLVIYLRETFIPLAVLLFFYIYFPFDKKLKIKNLSLISFLVFVLSPLLLVNLKDYYFSLFDVNKSFFVQNISDTLNVIFYPISILIAGKWNLFRILLIGTDGLFLLCFSYFIVWKRRFSLLVLFFPLILVNIRVVEPGKLFYESFHMIPFYGIFLTITFLLIGEIKSYNKKLWVGLILATFLLFAYYIASPQAFFREKINQHEEFITNYGHIMEIGEAVKRLSIPGQTFFADGFDEVVYWIAQRRSPYKYSMYTSLMPDFKIYSDQRIEMFKNNPPDLYYGSCPKEKNAQRLIPVEFLEKYLRLNAFGKPSCLFIRKDNIKKLTKGQLIAGERAGYKIPLDNRINF